MWRISSKLVLCSISLLAVICALFIAFTGIPAAFATGGAFPYTKHGGGTVDGIPFGGVDRAVNPDWGVYYNEAAEGGQYLSGECTHCHEPHASFGAAEPAPNTGNDAGPDIYLLMKDYGSSDQANRNYAELCWYCHESINFDPILGGGTGFWKFYQGKAVYQLTTHFTSANFYWPGTSGDPVTIWPRGDRTGLPSGNKGSCLNCHTPHGILEQSGSEFDTAAVPATGDCAGATDLHCAANNASVSTDYLIPRQLIAWEEGLCENCHDANGPAVNNIQTEIDKRSPSPSSAARSGHPVDDTAYAGRHVVNEALPITTKHVECYDCHNPHADKPPTGALGDGDGGRVKGMKYVDINGAVQDPALGARQPYVYEVCLKCHSATYATFIPDKAWPSGGHTLRTTVLRSATNCATNINPASSCTDGSNKRLEFDTATLSTTGLGANTFNSNRAYHPVAAPGRNTSAALNNQLLGNLTTAKTINCTDCHNNNAAGAGTFTGLTATPTYPGPVTESNLRLTDVNNGYAVAGPVGPHGSTNVRILRANYNTNLGTTGAAPFTSFDAANFALCFNCHDVRAFTDSDGIVGGLQMTNFRQSGFGCMSPKVNLHATHLTDVSAFGGWGFLNNMYTSCANCHYNVHSNAEATNTLYGDGAGGAMPADGDTHLINFSPLVQPYSYAKPRWWFTGGVMRCNLTCHGVTMEQGFGPNNADAWYTNYAS